MLQALTRLDDALVRLFSELPPRKVEVSLYGASPETYDRVTAVAGSFDRCLAGVDALRAAGVQVALKTVILTANRHEVAAMRRMAQDRDAGFRVDPAVFPRRDGDLSPLGLRVSPEEAVAIEMQDAKRAEGAAALYEKLRSSKPDDHLFTCMAGKTGFHVDPAGRLQPCLMVNGGGFDLREGSFREGWEGSLQAFREIRALPGYECNSCERRFLCGLCPAQAGMETGSPHLKSEYYCSLGRERELALSRVCLPTLPA